MLLARRNNDSDWLSNFFDDTLFNTEVMSRMNATAPAINIKETDKNYIMEVAAPGLKKEWVRVNIDNDGNLNIAIENKMDTRMKTSTSTICVANSLTATTSSVIRCLRMLIVRRFQQR